MALTLEQIDQLLANWQKKLDLVSQNLIDLHGLPAYQRLTGEPGVSGTELTGITQTQVSSALVALNELFQHFELLANTINRAASLRKQLPLFHGADRLNEIEQLLSGASIQLPVVQIPLAQRGLLSASETATAIAPTDLLAAMTHAFQVAKNVVLAVDNAWSTLETKLFQADAEIRSLKALAASLDVSPGSELEMAQGAIAKLRTQIESDPLGTTGGFEAVSSLLAKAHQSLQQAEQQRNQLRTGLDSAYDKVKRLVDLNQQAIDAFRESQEKVVDHSTLCPPLSQEQIDALSQWLDRLEVKFSERMYSPVNVGLTNWNTKANALIAKEENTVYANRLPVITRQELRGRLDALKAKALAKGMVEDPILTDLSERAKHLLYTRPTPLAEASDLVRQYEKRLNQFRL
jgi:hypothetical protein